MFFLKFNPDTISIPQVIQSIISQYNFIKRKKANFKIYFINYN